MELRKAKNLKNIEREVIRLQKKYPELTRDYNETQWLKYLLKKEIRICYWTLLTNPTHTFKYLKSKFGIENVVFLELANNEIQESVTTELKKIIVVVMSSPIIIHLWMSNNELFLDLLFLILALYAGNKCHRFISPQKLKDEHYLKFVKVLSLFPYYSYFDEYGNYIE
jgi:hypothetical protein